MADDFNVTVTLQGEPVTFRLGEMTAQDAGDFRRAVGVPLMQAISAGLDLDVVAGLLWLVKRRDQPKVSYQSIAATLTYNDLEVSVEDEADEEVVDPEV